MTAERPRPQEPELPSEEKHTPLQVKECQARRTGGINLWFSDGNPTTILTHRRQRKSLIDETMKPGFVRIETFRENDSSSLILRDNGTLMREGENPPSEAFVAQLPETLRSIEPKSIYADPNLGWYSDAEPRKKLLEDYAIMIELYVGLQQPNETSE